jgi:methionyl aminopeptidase
MLPPVSIESHADLEGLRRVGRVVALTLEETQRCVEPGVTTAELDAVADGVLARHGAPSAPKLVCGFPGAICVDAEVAHGIPGSRLLVRGDLVKLDVSAELRGYLADAAVTALVPPLVLTSAS